MFDLINPGSPSPLLITVEHAAAGWPDDEPFFGMPQDWNKAFDAYDKGVKDLSLALAARFGCTAILGCYSRLLVDLNRIPGEPAIIRTHAAGKIAPDNLLPMNQISDAQRDARIMKYYTPYHTAVRAQLMKGKTHHLCIHSYGLEWLRERDVRAVPLGIQYPLRTGMVESALAYFSEGTDSDIGDNEPFDLRQGAPGSISLHSAPFGIDNVELEFRDDQLTDPARAAYWLEHVSYWLEYKVGIRPVM